MPNSRNSLNADIINHYATEYERMLTVENEIPWVMPAPGEFRIDAFIESGETIIPLRGKTVEECAVSAAKRSAREVKKHCEPLERFVMTDHQPTEEGLGLALIYTFFAPIYTGGARKKMIVGRVIVKALGIDNFSVQRFNAKNTPYEDVDIRLIAFANAYSAGLLKLLP